MKQILFVCLLMTALLTVVEAQSSAGNLTGTVTDPSGAVVGGAVVTLTDAATNSVLTANTNAEGVYNFSSVRPATYTLTIAQTGFKTAVAQSVEVLTARTVTSDVTLEVGAAEVQVEITSDTELLTKDSAQISTTIETKLLEELPFPEQSALGAVLIAPGVQGDPQYPGGIQSENPGVFTQPTTPGGSLQISGGRPGSGSILVDGSDISLTSFPRTGVTFSGETVRQVTVQQNGLAAQYGRTGGGIINQTTRGGGNNFRGNFTWRHTDPSLQARTHGAPLDPQRRQNQFGLRVSGPVFLPQFGEGGPVLYKGRDRTFFFVSVEPLRASDRTLQRGRLATPDERAGRFNNSLELLNQTILRNQGIEAAIAAPRVGGLFYQFARDANGFPIGRRFTSAAQYVPIPGNDLSAQLARNPIAQAILAYYPSVDNPGQFARFLRPDGLSERDGNNALLSRGVQNIDNRFGLRIDHNATDNDRVAFRYAFVPVQGARFNAFGIESPANTIAQDQIRTHNAIVNYTRVFGSAVNDFRVSYTRARQFRGPSDVALSQDFGAQLGLRPATLGAGFPSLGGLIGGIGSGGSTDLAGETIDSNLGFSDDFSFARGNHNIKIGGDVRFLGQNRADNSFLYGGAYNFSGAFTNNGSVGGNGLASLILGIVNTFDVRTVETKFRYSWQYYAAYVQDDWKVRPNLTLNLGLRYNLELPRKEKNNLQGSFDPTATGTVRNPVTGLDVAATGGFVFAGENGRPERLWKTNYKGFEPRVGIAYSPFDFMTARASYALVHTPLTGLGSNLVPDLSAPSDRIQRNVGTVNPNADLNIITNPVGNIPPRTPLSSGPLFSFGGANLPFIDTSNSVPYVQLFSASLQFQIGRDTGFEVAYSGNKGTSLFSTPLDVNIPSFETLRNVVRNNTDVSQTRVNPYGITVNGLEALRPYQQFATNLIETAYDRRGSSIYHALYVSGRRRLSKGLLINGSYTWSKSIDNFSSGTTDFNATNAFSDPRPQNVFDLSLERSVSVYDIPHKFTVGYSYDLPVGKGKLLDFNNKILNYIFGGFKTSGLYTVQQGYPLFVTLGNAGYFYVTAANGARVTAIQDITLRPNIVPGVPFINPNWRDDPYGLGGGGYLNPAAFAVPGSPGDPQFGDAPRTLPYARNPNTQYFDASLRKEFRLGSERTRNIELRADFINVLNRPNFFFSPNAGRVLFTNNNFNPQASFGNLSQGSTSPGRTIHLGVKIAF